MKPTPGTIAGTMIVVLEGGPPEWAGTIDAVVKTGGGRLERWDHTADLAVVWERTERTQPVEIERHKRSGTVMEVKSAVVYEYRGYKEDQDESTGQSPAQTSLGI